jgi:CheY-like chemotaxis protein
LTDCTTFCRNGQEIIDTVESLLTSSHLDDKPIDAIMTDFQMPKKNGVEAIKEVKELYAKKQKELGVDLRLPEFIFLTAFMSPAFVKYIGDLGLNQIYEKPL